MMTRQARIDPPSVFLTTTFGAGSIYEMVAREWISKDDLSSPAGPFLSLGYQTRGGPCGRPKDINPLGACDIS